MDHYILLTSPNNLGLQRLLSLCESQGWHLESGGEAVTKYQPAEYFTIYEKDKVGTALVFSGGALEIQLPAPRK